MEEDSGRNLENPDVMWNLEKANLTDLVQLKCSVRTKLIVAHALIIVSGHSTIYKHLKYR